MKKVFIFFCRFIVFPFLKLFIKETRGIENLPSKNNFILASNHINGGDHWFLMYTSRERIKNLHFIGAMDNVKTFFQSALLYYLTDTIVINRKKIDRKKIIEKVSGYLKKGEIIIIYPEGDTNKNKKLLKGKTGIAELALQNNLPVIPVGILKEKNSKKRIIKIGKPIYFKAVERKGSYGSSLREVTDTIMREISKLSEKSYPY